MTDIANVLSSYHTWHLLKECNYAGCPGPPKTSNNFSRHSTTSFISKAVSQCQPPVSVQALHFSQDMSRKMTQLFAWHTSDNCELNVLS